LNWIGKGNKGNEKGESLVSISSDGKDIFKINFWQKNK